jgi:hypothetical protein
MTWKKHPDSNTTSYSCINHVKTAPESNFARTPGKFQHKIRGNSSPVGNNYGVQVAFCVPGGVLRNR